MSRAHAARLSKLEARKAKQGPRVIGVIAERFPRRWEERDGILHELPRFRPGEYELMAREQQRELLAKCAEFAEQLDEGDDMQAPHVGIVTERVPLPPGTKGKRYLHTTNGGKQFETDTHTGQTVEIK